MMIRKKKLSSVSICFVLLFLLMFFASTAEASSIKQPISLQVGQKKTFNIDSQQTITWSNSDPLVATVSSEGVIYARGVGHTIITAQYGKTNSNYIVFVSLSNNKIVYDDRTILMDKMKKNASEYQRRFHFATWIDKENVRVGKFEEKDVKKEIEDFLPQTQEFRVAYCDGWDVRYAYRREEDQRVYVEATVTFDYNPAAAVAAYYRGQKVTLNKKEKALLEQCEKVLKELNIKNLDTRWEKTWAIHNYIVANTAFDKAATEEEDWRDAKDSYSAYGALINKKATCKGYSQAMKLLLEAADVPCDYVVGKKNVLHAWNRVQLDDGKWYNIDASSNDPMPDKKGRILYTYYCITDEKLAKTHTWDNKIHEANAIKYNYENQKKLLEDNK